MMEPNKRLAINTQGLAPDAIRVAQARGSTYTSPRLKQGRSGLGELLQGLGGLNSSVDQFAEQRRKREEEEQSLAANEAFEGMTLEQARELVATKKINDYESPYFRAAFLARLGQNEAANRKRDLVSRFETDFDKINGNAEEWVREQTKADLDRLPKNEFVTKAYLAEIDGFANAIATKQVDAQVTEIKEARKEQVSQSINNSFLLAEEEGLAAEEDEEVVNPDPVPADDDDGEDEPAAARPESRPKPQPVSLDQVWSGWLKGVEGGYVAVDGRSGAPANFGINQRANPDINVAKLTEAQAVEIYRKRYWKASGADKLENPALQVVHMDTAVNMGVDAARKLLAKSGGNVARYLELRANRYKEIGGADLPAWLARNAKLTAYVGGLDSGAVGGIDRLNVNVDGPLVIPIEARAPRTLRDPNAYAARIFRTIDENAATNLATRREQEEMLLKLLPSLAEAGKDAQIIALLDYDRGPAGTLRSKLGPRAELIVEAAKNNREAKDDTAALGAWEQMQFKLGVKADRGQLTEDDVNAAKAFALDNRIRHGRKPLAGGEYFAGLVARNDNFLEREAEKARIAAEKAEEARLEQERINKIDELIRGGLGHELTGEEANEGITRAYQKNRELAGADHMKRRALDLQTFRRTSTASPFSSQLLANGVTALRGGVGVAPDGKVGTQLRLAIDEYAFYRKHAPNALTQVVRSEADRQLFDSYFALNEAGMTSQQAMLRMQEIASGAYKPRPITSKERQQIKDVIEGKAARLGAVSGWIKDLFGAKEGGTLYGLLFAGQENRSVVTGQIERYAETLMRAGANPNKAVEIATKKVASNWTQFDGILVNHNGSPIPQVFRKGLRGALNRVLSRPEHRTYRGSGLVQAKGEDVYVQAHPSARQQWIIYDRRNLRAPLATITSKDIADAVAAEANRPGFIEQLGIIGNDIVSGNLVTVRRTPAKK